MLSVNMLLDKFRDSLLMNCGSYEPSKQIRGILLYDEESDITISSDYIYLCSIHNLASLKDLCQSDIIIFCSDPAEDCFRTLGDSSWCSRLIVVKMSLFGILNRLTLQLNEYHDWISALRSAGDIQIITEIAANKFHYPAAVLDSFFFPNAIAFGSEPRSTIFRILEKNGRISSQQAAPIMNMEREYFNISSFALRDGDVKVTDYPIRYNNRVIARIFVETPTNSEPCAEDYVEDYINTIRPFLEAKDSLQKSSMNAVSTLISDVINQVLTDSEEIEERRKMLPDMVRGKLYHPVVIKFSNPGSEIPYNYISGQLEMIFPKCSVATYNLGLIVIVPKEDPMDKISFDESHFSELLTKFDAYAGIGNHTKYLTALRPLYIEAAATARLGQVFCEDKKNRIFYFNDYCMYFYVDMCIESAALRHSIGNVSYLCDPGVIRLIQYDRENGTSLFDTLKSFIDCGCNASLCAQQLYSHRNTVNYRIKLIEDILGYPLRNSGNAQKLGFSIKLIDYEEKYLKCDPVDASGKTSINVDWNSYISFSEKPYY